MAGVTHRVGEVFEILDRIPGSHDRDEQRPFPENGSGDSGSPGPLVAAVPESQTTGSILSSILFIAPFLAVDADLGYGQTDFVESSVKTY